VILSYRYRLYPNRAQDAALGDMLGDFCELYNCALDHRISAYAKGVVIRYNEQAAALPRIRRELPHQGRWSATAQQQVLRRLDKSYAAFFGRMKRGAKAGFPRFRARARYHAANFRVGDGMTLRKSGKLGFVGVPGEVKVKWHRALPSVPKSAILSRNAGKWFIILHVDVAPVERASLDSVGIDMGLTSLVAFSTGETVARPNITKRNARKLRLVQRTLARCKRRSKSRRKRKAAVAKLQAHISNARRDNLHKLSAGIVARFGRIAVEDLNIKGLAAGMLAKPVSDAAWSMLTNMLAYKAERAGCKLVKVDPRGTSQTCPECGAVAKKTLAERMHSCACGCTLDRDVAAAIMVHHRAFGLPHGACGGASSQRVAA
jgi:putative transposase